MAEKKRLAKQPMLYIAQPNFKPAEVPMQTSFRSQRQSKSNANSGENTSLYERELRLRNQNASSTTESTTEVIKEKQEEEKPAQPEASESKAPSSKDRKKRFGDLSLEGKVQYFLQLSPHMPKVKCEVVVNEESYRGYIVDYTNGIVKMKTFQRPFQKDISFKEIDDIKLLGF